MQQNGPQKPRARAQKPRTRAGSEGGWPAGRGLSVARCARRPPRPAARRGRWARAGGAQPRRRPGLRAEARRRRRRSLASVGPRRK